MKALTKLARVAIFAVLAVTVAVGLIWYGYFRPIIIQEALKSEAASLSFASSILESGARPEDWENRAFLPTTSIHDLAGSLTGLEFVASQGKRVEAGRYERFRAWRSELSAAAARVGAWHRSEFDSCRQCQSDCVRPHAPVDRSCRGGIGKDIDLIGENSIALPVSLKLEKRVTASGTAVVLQPQLSCTRIEIDVNPSTREDIIKEAWIALKPFGVRVKRNVGGRSTGAVDFA